MIRINLLPTKAQLKIPPVFGYGVIVILVLFIALVVSTIFLNNKVSHMQTDKSVKEKKLEELKKAIKEVENYEKANQEVREKTKVIEQLKKNQSVPLKLLDEVSEMLPKGVWLTTLTDKGGVINIEGLAHTNYDLVGYVQNLKGSKYFTDVTLVESRQTNIESYTIYKFTLTFRIKA